MAPDPTPGRLFHITTPAAAESLAAVGVLEPASLEDEGFVHCSTADQVVRSTARHFPPGEELVLIELDERRLESEVRWPEVYPGQRFPHLHGPVTAAAVVAVHPWGPEERQHWVSSLDE